MKKKIFSVVLLLFMFSYVNAQPAGLELGVRLGGFGGSGGAVDATIPFAGNRIHADLGFYNNAIAVAAFYDWSFPIADNFSFYPGIGAEVAIGDILVLGIGGELGFEYAFEFPLTIGMDWRPTIRLIDDNGFGIDGFGLNFRYRF